MNNNTIIESIESRFKQVTNLPYTTDLTVYPITEHIGFDIRTVEKKEKGEVFTPIALVDRMLEISQPQPDKFNMDLCAGRGQFTIRILRKFANENPNFDIDNYLTNFHWFNELNTTSALELIQIFGESINLAVGPAQALKNYPTDESGNWLKGIFQYDESLKKWLNIDSATGILINDKQSNKQDVEVNSKALF